MVKALQQIVGTARRNQMTRDTVHNTAVSRADARPDKLSTAALFRVMVNMPIDHYEDTTPTWPLEPEDWIDQDVKTVAPKLLESL